MPLPDCAEPRPLDDPKKPEELEVEALEEDDVEEPLPDPAPVDAVVDGWFDAADVPGRVAALTTANTPTPANAPMATPAVSRLRRRIASSRASILVWVRCWFSITMRKLEGRRCTKPGEVLGSY